MAELLDFEVTTSFGDTCVTKYAYEDEEGMYSVIICKFIGEDVTIEKYDFFTLEGVLTKVPELYPWVAND